LQQLPMRAEHRHQRNRQEKFAEANKHTGSLNHIRRTTSANNCLQQPG
jgi:hypothetical protein